MLDGSNPPNSDKTMRRKNYPRQYGLDDHNNFHHLYDLRMPGFSVLTGEWYSLRYLKYKQESPNNGGYIATDNALRIAIAVIENFREVRQITGLELEASLFSLLLFSFLPPTRSPFHFPLFHFHFPSPRKDGLALSRSSSSPTSCTRFNKMSMG